MNTDKRRKDSATGKEKLDRTLNCEAQGTPKKKVCEACGKEFACFSPRGPCWCEDVKVSREMLAELRAKYRECLCPACLELVAKA